MSTMSVSTDEDPGFVVGFLVGILMTIGMFFFGAVLTHC